MIFRLFSSQKKFAVHILQTFLMIQNFLPKNNKSTIHFYSKNIFEKKSFGDNQFFCERILVKEQFSQFVVNVSFSNNRIKKFLMTFNMITNQYILVQNNCKNMKRDSFVEIIVPKFLT